MNYLRESSYYYIEGLTGQFDTVAQAYSCDAYGAGAYGECATTTTGGSRDGLVDTGVAIGLFAGIAALLVFITVLVMVWRRKGAKNTPKVGQKNQPTSPQQPVQKPANTDIMNDRKG